MAPDTRDGAVVKDGHDERMRRWRLVLGEAGVTMPLGGGDARIDAALGVLYDSDVNAGGPGAGQQDADQQDAAQRHAGFGASAPRVARWLGDIRAFFPVSVVQVMQKDAIERLGLTRLLLEPEMLDAVEPDVHLVGTLLSLSRVIPDQARESARAVVRAVTSGGTDINQAVAYCQQLITRPASTIFILISDLFEGGDRDEMLRRIADMTAAGTQVIVLLALSDDGTPGYDHENAAALAGLGVIAFACTPDAFPDLMAAAIERRDLATWAQGQASTPRPPP